MRWNVSDDRELLSRLGHSLRSTREPPPDRVERLRREVAARRPADRPAARTIVRPAVALGVAAAIALVWVRAVRRRRSRERRGGVWVVITGRRRAGQRPVRQARSVVPEG
jgi:hypothetical protein